MKIKINKRYKPIIGVVYAAQPLNQEWVILRENKRNRKTICLNSGLEVLLEREEKRKHIALTK